MANELAKEMKEARDSIFSKVLNNDLHGKRIYLLGSAEFGPTNEPILVKSTVGLHNKFGNTGSLIDGWHAIKYISRDNQVFCVKTTGTHSAIYLNVNPKDGDVVTNGLVFYASQSNELFDDFELVIGTDNITFNFPIELNISAKTYKYTDYPTIGRLVDAINKETRAGKNFIYGYYDVDPDTPVAGHTSFPVNLDVYTMSGGSCGVNYTKDMLYNCLTRTYQMLESHDIDIIIPLDAFMDDIHPDMDLDEDKNYYGQAYYHAEKDYLMLEDYQGRKCSFMDQLINFCILQLNFGVVTTGVIGYNSSYKYWSNYLSESDDLIDMYKVCFDYNLSLCLNPWYAFMVSVVAGDIMYNHGTIIDNGYLAYGAMIADTSTIDNITNRPIKGAVSIWHEFSEYVLYELADYGIVTFRHSPLYNRPVVYDAVTASHMNENLKLQCNVRMVQLCISYINQLFQIYIGFNLQKLIDEEIIQNDLSNLLNQLVEMKVINWFEFALVPEYYNGYLKVYLSLKTNYMVKSVQICSLIDIEYLEE